MATIKSIEEKAKAYDEAVEKLRSLHDNYDTVSTLIDIKEELENIFPELKESEDERIRKALLELVHDTTGDSLWVDYNVHKEDALAWLEKQGSQILANSAKTCKDEQKSEEEEVDNLHDYLYGEQKPAWSEEDEKYLKLAIENFQTLGNSFLTTWLKSLKERVQPKQEWSEEDEDMRYKATAVINRLCAEGKEYVWSIDTLKKLFYWLKSLKPQTTWKPSDDEMKALAEALSLANNCGEEYAFDLRTLYEQLKKLNG